LQKKVLKKIAGWPARHEDSGYLAMSCFRMPGR